jgi:hypothetical protein
MGNVNFQDILNLLAPGGGQDFIWSIFLYIIFILAMITLFTIPDKNMISTLLMASVMLMAIVAKISLASADPILRRKEFGMMVVNVLMGVFPLLVFGMVRSSSKRKFAGAPLAIIGGLLGFAYFFMFWFFVQQN